MGKIRNKLASIGHTLESICLCLRFPFLYPRNRFSGVHHTWWRWREWRRQVYIKNCKVSTDGKAPKGSKTYGLEMTGMFVKYWTSWWSKPLYGIMGWLHDNLFQIPFVIPTYTELDNMEKGWRKTFGVQMCKELKSALKKTGSLKHYRILDIKEKYGTLRWYDNGGNVDTNKIIDKYEYISARTCCVCGAPATCITPVEYWKCPYCDNCAPKQSRYLLDYGLDGLSWYGVSGNVNMRSEEDFEERKKMFREYEENRQ